MDFESTGMDGWWLEYTTLLKKMQMCIKSFQNSDKWFVFYLVVTFTWHLGFLTGGFKWVSIFSLFWGMMRPKGLRFVSAHRTPDFKRSSQKDLGLMICYWIWPYPNMWCEVRSWFDALRCSLGILARMWLSIQRQANLWISYNHL